MDEQTSRAVALRTARGPRHQLKAPPLTNSTHHHHHHHHDYVARVRFSYPTSCGSACRRPLRVRRWRHRSTPRPALLAGSASPPAAPRPARMKFRGLAESDWSRETLERNAATVNSPGAMGVQVLLDVIAALTCRPFSRLWFEAWVHAYVRDHQRQGAECRT